MHILNELLSDEDTYEFIQMQELANKKLMDTHIYALVKVHEENNPIRPMVSFVKSATYDLYKILSKLFTPISNLSHNKLQTLIKQKNK